jgi:uncharacterized protein (TIGR01777 family)
MRILGTGMSGSIGRALIPALSGDGHKIVRLKTGSTERPDDIPWDPLEPLDPQTVSGYGAVIHLAGESVFGLWTKQKKYGIRVSRVMATRNLAEALARAREKPKTFISASAIGFYGTHASEPVTEEAEAGEGFLAEVAHDWEDATELARKAGIRVVNLRIGVVLSRNAGAFTMMLRPFRLGLGGKMGSGTQYLSWIHVADAAGAIRRCLHTASIAGPVNLVAPNPVTNAEFSQTLAHALKRPAIFSIPRFLLRLLPGDMARETLLASQNCVPKRLLESGFRFAYPDLKAALKNLLPR